MTAPTLTCPGWCTKTHTDGPGYAIVHEDDEAKIDLVPEPRETVPPTIVVTLTRIDDEPVFIGVDGDLLTADAAERLALALMDRVVVMRQDPAVRSLPVGGRR